MLIRAWLLGGMGLLCVAVAAGCPSTKPTTGATEDEQAAIRATFAELQAVLKTGDANKLWTLLDSKSQADAERAAKSIQTTYGKAGPEEKIKQEEALGLKGEQLSDLTGKGYLKTKRFQAKYREVPESTIEDVVMQGDSATVHYLEPDGDKEKLILVRQDGRWKVWLTMPRGSQP